MSHQTQGYMHAFEMSRVLGGGRNLGSSAK